MDDLKDQFDRLLDIKVESQSDQVVEAIEPAALLEILNLNVPEKPVPEAGYESFLKHFFRFSVDTNHPNYVNQLWSKTSDSSVVGELAAALSNTSMYTYEVAPVATLLEITVRDWLSNRIWGRRADGIMTSGGTASNLQALLTARNQLIDACKQKGLAFSQKAPVLLAAENAHYSIKRAANILGLGHEGFFPVPVNRQGQMTAESLERALSEVSDQNKQPFCVVSTAGTTVEGAYDDLALIGEMTKTRGLWFHVDGAYGGSALLSQKHRGLMRGVELADSLTWDFHKTLGINLPCAFLLVKEKGKLRQSLSSGNDSYLFHQDEDSYDLGPSSLQCGRRNDILKLWLSWMKVGTAGFEARVNRLFELADEFSRLIEDHPKFDLLLRPQSINVCFRLKGENHTQRIREKLRDNGSLMMNYSSDQDGDFFRLAVTNPELTSEILRGFVELIEEASLG